MGLVKVCGTGFQPAKRSRPAATDQGQDAPATLGQECLLAIPPTLPATPQPAVSLSNPKAG